MPRPRQSHVSALELPPTFAGKRAYLKSPHGIDLRKQRRDARRIARWIEGFKDRNSKTKKWVPFSRLALESGRADSIQAAYDRLFADFKQGMFNDPRHRSRVLFLHPGGAIARRMTRDRMPSEAQFRPHSGDGTSSDGTITLYRQYLAFFWVPNTFADVWRVKHNVHIAPKTTQRRGPGRSEINDDAAVVAMARYVFKLRMPVEPAARKVMETMGIAGHNPESTVKRLARKFKRQHPETRRRTKAEAA